MTPHLFDHIFRTKLHSWTQFRSGYQQFFNPREIDLLGQSERSFDPASRTVVLLAFENEYASLGGLSVVTRFIPAHLRKAGESVVFVTPYHGEPCFDKRGAAQREVQGGVQHTFRVRRRFPAAFVPARHRGFHSFLLYFC